MAKGGQERLAKVAELGLNEDKVARERSGKGTAGRGHSQCRDTEAGTSQGHSRRVSPGNGGETGWRKSRGRGHRRCRFGQAIVWGQGDGPGVAAKRPLRRWRVVQGREAVAGLVP